MKNEIKSEHNMNIVMMLDIDETNGKIAFKNV